MKSALSKDRVSGTICLALGVAVYLLSKQFPSLDDGYPGPGLFPSIIGSAMGLSGLFILVRPEANTDAEPAPRESNAWRIVALVALMILAYFLAPVVGLLPVVAGIVILAGLLAGVDIRWAITASVVTTIFIYVVFTLLLGVPI